MCVMHLYISFHVHGNKQQSNLSLSNFFFVVAACVLCVLLKIFNQKQVKPCRVRYFAKVNYRKCFPKSPH